MSPGNLWSPARAGPLRSGSLQESPAVPTEGQRLASHIHSGAIRRSPAQGFQQWSWMQWSWIKRKTNSCAIHTIRLYVKTTNAAVWTQNFLREAHGASEIRAERAFPA